MGPTCSVFSRPSDHRVHLILKVELGLNLSLIEEEVEAQIEEVFSKGRREVVSLAETVLVNGSLLPLRGE